nr:reverse transcriptase domain-containing protein [Tanacetum cinerariifolium]
AARRWLEKEPSRSITTWDNLVSKFINEFFPPSRTTNLRNEISKFQQKFDESFHEAWERYKDLLRTCPHHGFTGLHQLDTFYNALNPADQDSLNAAADGNLLEKVLKMLNQQTSTVTTAVTAMLKQIQSNPPPAQVKVVKEICVTYGGNYNQGNPGYHPQGVANQMRPPGFAQPNVQNNQNRFGQPQGFNRSTNFNQEQPYQATAQSNQNFHLNELEKIKRMNNVSLKAVQNQIDMVKNELRNEMKTSIQTSLSNRTNEIKNMMASLLQINTASTSGSGSLPGNTVANPKGKFKAITTRSGLATDGPIVPNPPKSVNPEKDECPRRESVNLINIFNLSSEDCLEDLVSHKQSGNPTFSLHKEIASPEVTHEFNDSKGSNSLLEEFADELALITYLPDYDDNRTCDIESDLREIEFLLYQGEDYAFKDSIDQTDLTNLDDLFVDPTPEMFTDEQPPDYSFPPRFDVYPDDFLEIESNANNFDDDLFDSKGEKIKEAKLLIAQLDLPCDILSEYDSFNS